VFVRNANAPTSASNPSADCGTLLYYPIYDCRFYPSFGRIVEDVSQHDEVRPTQKRSTEELNCNDRFDLTRPVHPSLLFGVFAAHE